MRARIIAATASTLLIVSMPLAAQAPSAMPGQKNVKLVTGGIYKIDPYHSQVQFSFDHLGITTNMGLIATPSGGSLILDPKKPSGAKVWVEFPVTNIRTAVADFDKHLMSKDFFDAEKFPTARFESTSVKVSGTNALIQGNLTIKGITKPISLKTSFTGVGAHPMNKKENIGFSATTQISRSAFGLGYGVPMVGDTLSLTISAAFEKQD